MSGECSRVHQTKPCKALATSTEQPELTTPARPSRNAGPENRRRRSCNRHPYLRSYGPPHPAIPLTSPLRAVISCTPPAPGWVSP
ncbi:hypothetical protein PoB_001984100 [Plakobranchus ocellatus]|uniref:Uncharacterized protein n=1 Tax=Plakobranchus ocellatus TaxID=259542 RepID=A0AAV3Z1Y9_9GAST|nr:hypothetical protein PoB_001984100 [Plakobranchus ocellatus]